MMQPHRIDVVQQRAARYAEANGLDRTFVKQLYDLIIGETCRIEDLIIDSGTEPPAFPVSGDERFDGSTVRCA